MKIEHGIPIPPHDGRGVYARTKWTELFATMASGDSFVCTLPEYRSARLSAYVARVEIVSRKLDRDSYRIWKA